VTGSIAGIRVLDFTVGIAGPYATKLLADYGADVVKVEPPGGDFTRRLGPYPGDVPHPERSGTFLFFNTNKRSVILDLKTGAGREAAWKLIDWADVVVESFRPGVFERLGLAFPAIHARRPAVPLVSVSNFGQDGPYRDYRGTELTLYGFGGELYTVGVAEREPVTLFGTAALVESGAAAATAVLGAAFVGIEQGIGQHVDFSIVDSHFGGADRRHAMAIAYEFSGRKSSRVPLESRALLRGVYPCADGYVELSGAGTRLDRVRTMLGNPEWLADPKWSEPGATLRPDLTEEFEGYFYPWLYEHTKREIWEAAREARVLCGPLFTIEELAADPHFRERGFWEVLDHPEMGRVEIPGRPFIMNASPWELRRPAPLLGQHTAEVLAEAGAREAVVR
jgi:crotonobetainyl-CoA:carnitine CoA-transferase CaiB-like acyl-CoA transferase